MVDALFTCWSGGIVAGGGMGTIAWIIGAIVSLFWRLIKS